ncbi:MAG: hypothetical protein HN855_00655 [Anaerolineae bacterium]|jgi:hypothetical protein|nr:hypothetical protein [Anaerolineae bacterium]MBT7072539.1 hypothetical protein [Anaerolineae bacterium]MBT7323651.1 hypothetical protein [Anaerolineae bacterium]
MQCPNCGNQTPSTTDKCRICGSPIEKAGVPTWAKDLLKGMGIGLVVFALLGAGYYFFYLQPARSVPQPTETSAVIIEPTAVPPTVTEVLAEILPSETPTPEPTLAPAETPTSTPEAQYCDLFKEIDMTIVYLDWFKKEDLGFYIKMPGGVPGLEKEISDASDEWEYRVRIGLYNSYECEFIAGYKERLYCEISLPPEYESAMHPISLYVNTCDEDVFESPNAFLPEIQKK